MRRFLEEIVFFRGEKLRLEQRIFSACSRRCGIYDLCSLNLPRKYLHFLSSYLCNGGYYENISK